jgi:Ice-binding-like
MNTPTRYTTQSEQVGRGIAVADARSNRNYPGLLAILGFAVLACVVLPALAQNISLGTAATFGVLGGSTVTNTGLTVVTGDVGVWAGTSITGFPPGTIFPGSGALHSGDPVAQQAQSDLTAAYNDAVGRACPLANNLTGSILGSGGTVLTLAPGVYCFDTSAQLTGNLILNGAGVYIFQIGTTLTTATASSITLTNGASACGVWWQVGSSATLGTATSLAGNVLAFTSITLTTDASVSGGTLARNGAVTLDTNNVTACGHPAQPGLSTQASPGTTLGGTISDTATVSGGVNPTGTITFQLFGPNDAACSSAAISTSTVAVMVTAIIRRHRSCPTR